MNQRLRPAKKTPLKLKLLTVIFDFEINRRNIPAFRAAVIKKVGRENVLFHNHLGKRFRYGYPLIQYKTIDRKPSMICINQGSDEILKFFGQADWDITIHERRIETEIQELSLDYFECGFSAEPLRYSIHNWFALNKANFDKYYAMKQAPAKTDLLRRVMIGNMLSFAKGIGWDVDQPIEVMIPHLLKARFFSFKNYQMVGFDLDFVTNVSLPNFIGLGKSVSRGFGVITRMQ